MKAAGMSEEAIRPGYKRTEVGVIPDDWDVKKLGEVADVIMGQSPAGSSYNRIGTGIPLINGPTEFTEKHPARIQWTTEPTKLAKEGDLLLCVRGSSTGRSNISDDTYCIGRGVAAIRGQAKTDTAFVIYVVTNAVGKILSLTTGSTFPNIDGKTLRSIEFPYPLILPEQEAIAEALSDADALLDALDRLIAKKRAIKQGAMQALLTGRVRLPGFERKSGYKRTEIGLIPSDWDIGSLREYFSIKTGASKSRYINESGPYLIVDMGSVSRTGELIAAKSTDFAGDFLNREDLVMPKDDIGGGNIIGKVAYIDESNRYVLGDHVYALSAKQGDPRYLDC